MKKLFIFLVVALCSLSGWSAVYNVVSVNLSDGSSVDIQMTDGLKLQFDDENLIATGIDADVSILKADIVNFVHSYDESLSGVKNVVAEEQIKIENGSMLFHNLQADSSIAIFDINGIAEYKTTAEGDYTLSLEGLKKGVHIVVVNNVSYKVIIK